MSSDDSDDEYRKNMQPKGLDAQGLAYMPKDQIEDVMTKFQPLKVPCGNLERIFLYFKKYPKEFNRTQADFTNKNTSLYSALNQSSSTLNQKGNKASAIQNLNRNTPSNNIKKDSKISVKTFENPMLKAKIEPKEEYQKTTEKIFDEIPHDRTLLVINFDKEYDKGFIWKVFSTAGKLRRVESGKIRQHAKGAKKFMFFSVVIFKHDRDMIRGFDQEYFQQKLLEKFMPEYRNMTANEKELQQDNYMKSMDGAIDYSNQIGMTEDGYMMIQQDTGIVRKEKSIAKYDGRRKHKKKIKEKADFYKFQMKNINDRRVVFQEDGIEQMELMNDGDDLDYNEDNSDYDELDIKQLGDDSYLQKRKEILKTKFQEELKAINANKKVKK